jgi:hypothetical protein
MPNMSYCRFENTNHDLSDCIAAIGRMMDSQEGPLSDRELRAAKQLAGNALELVNMLADLAGLDMDDLDSSLDPLDDAIDIVQDMASETPTEE